jgi:hypothetical protein
MQTRLWLVALCVLGVLGGCAVDPTDGPRSVYLDRLEVAISKTRPDGTKWDSGFSSAPEVHANVVIDGRRHGSCRPKLLSTDVVCKLDAIVTLSPDSRIELDASDLDGATSEPIGKVALDHLGARIPARGKAALSFEPESGVTAATLHVSATWTPYLGTLASRVLGGVVGVALAFVLLAVLRRRFLTDARGYWRSPAQLSGTGANIIGLCAALPLASRSDVLEPWIVALPLALGAFAASCAVIDAFAAQRLDRHGMLTLAGGVAAIVAVPLLVALAALAALGPWMIGVVIAFLILQLL